MKNVKLQFLKQARKHTHLCLQDMAFVLDMDISNLSKYERGKLFAPSQVVLSYHILSKIPLERLLREEVKGTTVNIVQRVKSLLELIEKEEPSAKNRQRITALEQILERVDLFLCPGEVKI